MKGYDMGRGNRRKRDLFPLRQIVLGVALAIGVLLISCWFVWLPDIITGKPSVVIHAATEKGHRFAVWQRWNYYDFYTTGFAHEEPGGESCGFVIEGDDKKRWLYDRPLIDDENSTVSIDIPGPYTIFYEWELHRAWYISGDEKTAINAELTDVSLIKRGNGSLEMRTRERQ